MKKDQVIELKKETPTSVIAVSRDSQLNLSIVSPKTLDELYATVPEITRSIDLRGAAVIGRGYEITARDESEPAKTFASIVSKVLNDSGGVEFFERFQKNADLYGDAYVELVDTQSKITSLAHVHPFEFGYEIEEFLDAEGQLQTRVKLDNDDQLPVGFASYKFNDTKNLFENDQKFELERIAHLKYKVTGDALYGISLILPMYGSVLRKLQIESYIESAGRLVAAPKIVITGNFEDDDEARREAKEAASLDVSDVVILQDGKEFEIVNPGQTSLPELREIFVVNITTASGIPRPILTSEGNDINKATMTELMKHLRDQLRSNMNKIKAVMEMTIFPRIGESYGIANFENLVPIFNFPEDRESEDEIIVREERKAATLTSLSNSIIMMNTIMVGTAKTPPNAEMAPSAKESMTLLFETFNDTIDTFMVNNDQALGKIEEEPIDVVENSVELNVGISQNFSLTDEIERIRQPDVLISQHKLVHAAFAFSTQGNIIMDPETNSEISMMDLIEKHRFYVDLMKELGINHESSEEGKELDEIYYKLQDK